MKKSISNVTLLSVLFLLGACSTTDSDKGNVEESSATSILNSALAGAFTGTANDQSTIVNATAGTAGIEPGGIIITSGANGVFTSVSSTAVTFADADNNTSAQQNSAMQQAVKTAVDAILRVSDNAVLGLSKGSIVVVKLSDVQKAEATVTLSTTDGYVFEDKKNTRTFVIVLTSSDLHTSNILNTKLVEAFTGAANDKSTTINETVGTAGIESGEITINSDANGVFASVSSTVTVSDADNTPERQISAMQNSVKTAVDAILRVSDNTVVGLSTESTVVVKPYGSQTSLAIATVTLSTTGDYLFEDNSNIKTFVIALTIVEAPTYSVLNTKLSATFTGAANDQSTTINATAGTVGIESGGITITSEASGIFTSINSTVTVSDADNTSERQILAMQNSVKTAVDAILRVSDNTVVGLSTESTVTVRTAGAQTFLATVTLSTTGDYLFENNSNIKTITIVLTIAEAPTYSVLNTKLASTFTGAANDQSTTINATTGTAGINSGGITITSEASGIFTSINSTILAFATADNTSALKISAMQNSVKTAVDNILRVSGNAILGLSTESAVIIQTVGNERSLAIVTLSTTGEYLFEDKKNTRTFSIVLTNPDLLTSNILNTKLASTFTGAANDKSVAINVTTGTAGINSGGITINSDASGVFASSSPVITFATADNTPTQQISAMQNAVKKAVDAILKVSDNAVLGLFTESTVVVNRSDAQKAKATVTLSTRETYLFEDKKSTRTFVIVLTIPSVESIIDPTAFNVPATTAIQGTAGTASFTIPIGFDDVTAKVPTYFHNKDNLLYDEKKNALTKAFRSMSTPTGVQITAVEEDIRSSKVTVTFGAKDGYKFIDSSSSKKFTIHLSGFFGDSQQTIEEPAYFVKGFGVIPNGIQLDSGLVQNTRLVHATARGNVNTQKIAVMKALDQMFYDASSFAPLLPEGIKYTKTSPRARVKLDSKGNPMLYDNQGYFIITLPRLDESYIFNQADQAKKEITIRVQWIPGS